MIPLSKILKDSEAIVIRRVKKRSYPLVEDTYDPVVSDKIISKKKIVISEQKLKNSKNNKKVEESFVVIRKRIKK